MGKKVISKKQFILIIFFAGIVVPIIFFLLDTSLENEIALDQSRREEDFTTIKYSIGEWFTFVPAQSSPDRDELLLLKPKEDEILLKFPHLSSFELSDLEQMQKGEEIEVKVLKSDIEAARHLTPWRKLKNWFVNDAEKMVLVYQAYSQGKTIFERNNTYPNAVNRYSHVSQRNLFSLAWIPLLLIAALIGKIRRNRKQLKN